MSYTYLASLPAPASALLPCSWEKLIQDVDFQEFYPCLLDDNEYIVLNKTTDPMLVEWLKAQNRTLSGNDSAPSTNESSLNTSAASPAAQPQYDADLFNELREHMPRYHGMPHPPPKTGNPQCDDLPWSVPYLPSYEGPLHMKGDGGNLTLTMCNYYLPAAPHVAGIHR